MKAQGWKAEREFNSREYAAAFYACMGWMAECSRRQKTGQAMTTIEDVCRQIEDVCRQAVERASHARLADISQAGDELDRDDMRDLPPLEVLQRAEAGKRNAPCNRAGDIPAFLHDEGEEAFDRFVCESEGGEGCG